MGGRNVKNTMIEWVLERVAPHLCSGCGKSGSILCHDCKNDIDFESFDGCLQCGKPQPLGICPEHHSPLKRAFVVGARQGALQILIDNLKFHNVKAASVPLAQLLDDRLPVLPKNTILVPIPTASSHIRKRGFDQVDLLLKRLSHVRGIPAERLLKRIANTTQHTETKAVRKQQAKNAFTLHRGITISPDATYLLIDDVITTGSTILAAAKLIQDAGGTVWAAGLAYQPLD